ncbi:MAG: FAD-binding oxidoreductase [Cyclobacteriaceae bacterium]
MEKVDVLIVGQGLAGSALSRELIRTGHRIKIIDNPSGDVASKVAGGLYNPITGRKMVKTWMADELFYDVQTYYDILEEELKTRFHYPSPIYRPFFDAAEQNDWFGKSSDPSFVDYVERVMIRSMNETDVADEHGGLMLKRSGSVDLPIMLRALKDQFVNRGIYLSELFDHKKHDHLARIYDDRIGYNKIIFCEGTGVKTNPFWNELKFRPVKGEVLTLKCDYRLNFILNRGVFMIPRDGFLKVGSTYNNNDQTLTPTDRAKIEILGKLEKIYTGATEVIDHQVGVRPATFDRRPFVGFHPKYTKIGIFNGFGAKGVTLVPYFAKKMALHLREYESLPLEVSISR